LILKNFNFSTKTKPLNFSFLIENLSFKQVLFIDFYKPPIFYPTTLPLKICLRIYIISKFDEKNLEKLIKFKFLFKKRQ